MNTKEAIEIIKIAIAEVEWNYPMEHAVAFEEAIEALEKQIPKEPIEDYYMDSDPITGEPYPVGIVYFCPNCGTWLVTENDCGEKKRHCSECGQAVDWSDVDE